MSDHAELLTVREAAALAKQADGTIRRKIARGEIPAIRLGSSDRTPLRIPRAEFETWLFRFEPSRGLLGGGGAREAGLLSPGVPPPPPRLASREQAL
jgi:excisionase family DNA binding protein